MKNLLTILLILLPLSAHAWGVVVSSGGVAGGGEPVTKGAIGNSAGANSSEVTITAVDYGVWTSFTTVTAGQVNTIHAYMTYCDGTQTFNAAIYSADGSTKLAEGNITTLSGEPTTLDIPLDSVATVEASTAYRICIGSKGSDYWRIATTDGGGQVRYDNSWDVEDTLPSALDNNGQQANYYTLRIWATYE